MCIASCPIWANVCPWGQQVLRKTVLAPYCYQSLVSGTVASRLTLLSVATVVLCGVPAGTQGLHVLRTKGWFPAQCMFSVLFTCKEWEGECIVPGFFAHLVVLRGSVIKGCLQTAVADTCMTLHHSSCTDLLYNHERELWVESLCG